MTIAVATPKPALKTKNKIVLGVALVIGLGLGLMMLGMIFHGSAPARSAPQSPPPSFKSVDSMITAVNVSGDTMVISEDIPSAGEEADYVGLSGATAMAVGQALQHGGYAENTAGLRTVVIDVRGGAQDRLGKVTMNPLVSFSLAAADLKAANYDNLQWAGVLDLAEKVTIPTRLSGHVVSAYCKANLTNTPHFCAKAAAALQAE